MRFKGKVALVTGGTSGIGFATAQLLAKEGAEVMICGRDAARLESALRRLGGPVAGARCDVSREADVDRLLTEVERTFGGLDICVCNAGIETDEERIGESWSAGSLVVSWEDVIADLAEPDAGCSVLIHEFAHQLDEEESLGEGVPTLGHARAYRSWSEVFSREYEAHCAAVDRGRRTLLDEYGAESPAEFFAVATEAFFLLGIDLRMRHPDLYRELASYYRQDPASWQPAR